MGNSIAIPSRVFTLAHRRATAALFAWEGGEVGAAAFVGEKQMFCGGAMQAHEFGYAEALLRGDLGFTEERGVKHRGVVGGKQYRNAVPEKPRQWERFRRLLFPRMTKTGTISGWLR